MATQCDGQRRQRVLERAVGLDRHRAAGDPLDVGEIAAKQVQWMKTADRGTLIARRRQQFDRRRATAVHERLAVRVACSVGGES